MSSDSGSNSIANFWSSSSSWNWRHALCHVAFWPRDSNAIFEVKIAQLCALVKLTIFIVDIPNFGIVYFKRYIFVLCGKQIFRFIDTLNFFAHSVYSVYNFERFTLCHVALPSIWNTNICFPFYYCLFIVRCAREYKTTRISQWCSRQAAFDWVLLL